MTSKQFIEKFPKSKLNIDNPKINEILTMFIIEYTHKLDKTWDTVKNYLFKFFKIYGIIFPSCNDVQPKFWESRGWYNPVEKAKEQYKLFPTTVEYWIQKGFSYDDANKKTKEFYAEKIKKSGKLLPTQLAYYTNKKGLSEHDAIISLKKEQGRRATKLVKKELDNPILRKERLWNNIEYWTKRGYSEEQGYILMSHIEKSKNYQTLAILTQKFIDSGYDPTNAKQLAKLEYKKRSEKSQITKIENGVGGYYLASKQSLKIFQPIMDYLEEQKIVYHVGIEGNTEFFLASGIEYFYSYDFCIPSKKIILEYHGEHVHPNPKMNDTEWNNWSHCWSKKGATECRLNDLKKIELAKSEGFKVIEIFESDIFGLDDFLKVFPKG